MPFVIIWILNVSKGLGVKVSTPRPIGLLGGHLGRGAQRKEIRSPTQGLEWDPERSGSPPFASQPPADKEVSSSSTTHFYHESFLPQAQKQGGQAIMDENF